MRATAKFPNATMRRAQRPFRLGVIADTHGLFDPAIPRCFDGIDHIIHAGDIGGRSVLRQLEAIAPVTAVSGNVDGFGRSGFPSERIVELSGRRIAVCHILYERGMLTQNGLAFLEREQPDICIFGHTHRPLAEWLGRTFLFNPGSAGPKRFTLPRALGIILIDRGEVNGHHIALADRAGEPGPDSPPFTPLGKGRADGRQGAGAERSLRRRGRKC